MPKLGLQLSFFFSFLLFILSFSCTIYARVLRLGGGTKRYH